MKKISISILVLIIINACSNTGERKHYKEHQEKEQTQKVERQTSYEEQGNVQGQSNKTPGKPVVPNSLKNNKYPFVVYGHIEGGGFLDIVFDQIGIGSKIEPLASTVADSFGYFAFSGTINKPGLYQVRFPTGVVHIVLVGNDSVTFETDIDHISQYKITHGKETQQLTDFYYLLNKYNDRLYKLQDRLDNSPRKEMLQLYDSLPLLQARIAADKSEDMKSFIDKLGNSFAAVLALVYIDPEKDTRFLMKKTEQFEKLYPNNEFIKSLQEKVELYKPFAVGSIPPDIVLDNTEGKEVKLSSLRGKYVLVDFWASWCKPCRKENPEIVKIYDRYKTRGFEIYGISLDENKADWLKAIKEDNIKWIQVSDLVGWESGVAQAYKVSAIPKTFLLDPKGRIIAKDIRAMQLREELQKVMM